MTSKFEQLIEFVINDEEAKFQFSQRVIRLSGSNSNSG